MEETVYASRTAYAELKSHLDELRGALSLLGELEHRSLKVS